MLCKWIGSERLKKKKEKEKTERKFHSAKLEDVIPDFGSKLLKLDGLVQAVQLKWWPV